MTTIFAFAVSLPDISLSITSNYHSQKSKSQMLHRRIIFSTGFLKPYILCFFDFKFLPKLYILYSNNMVTVSKKNISRLCKDSLAFRFSGTFFYSWSFYLFWTVFCYFRALIEMFLLRTSFFCEKRKHLFLSSTWEGELPKLVISFRCVDHSEEFCFEWKDFFHFDDQPFFHSTSFDKSFFASNIQKRKKRS